MDPRMKKNNKQKNEGDTPSPVLLRRRLSAPETVMRKYKLERARSQESDSEAGSFTKFVELSYNSHSGSEMNLQKKKDAAVMMRKSTLLRRLMNNPKTFGSSSFQEWQHYCGKLSTPSLNSLQGSPEHMSKSYSRRSLIGYEYKTSPKHVLSSKKVSPVHQLYETHKKSPAPLVSSSPKRRTDNHGYQVQTTKPKESTISSSHKYSLNDNSRSKTIDQSDSAYSNDRSHFTPISVSSSSSNNSHRTTKESIILKHSLTNMDQRNVDENRNFSVDPNYVTNETSTQTVSATNLNVISNVKLSQKTLDMIVNEVMKDVQQSCVNGNDIQGASGGSIHVQKISGMNTKPIKTNEKPNEFLKCLNDGSRHAEEKSSRISVISTLSSIGDKSDNVEDQSDVASLVDSLEDTSSSRLSFKKYDEKPVRGDLPPIPLRGRRKLLNVKPPDAFFVPMKKEIDDTKSVSDYLPEKLKDKILRRHKSRQEKLNNNEDTTKSRSQKAFKNRIRFRKPLLPSIETFRKKQEPEKEGKEDSRNIPKKTRTKPKNNSDTYRKTKLLKSPKEQHFDVFTSENDFVYNGGPRRIYHKAEFRNNSRRIEILEIMECVDITKESDRLTTKTKSKIPILRKPKATLSPLLVKKSALLDFNEVFKADPSLDQLITDILIQSLTNRDVIRARNEKEVQEELMDSFRNKEQTNESGVQVSEHELNETNKVPDTENVTYECNHNEGPIIAKDSKNTQTLADDWADFQQTQRKEELSDHTSNEGRKPLIETRNRKLDDDGHDFSNEEWGRRWRRMNARYEMDSNENNNFYEKVSLPPPMDRRYAQSSRRARYNNTPNGNPTPGEWSIILSGMNNATTASDLEMKIRFPSSRRASISHFNSDLDLGGIKDHNEGYSDLNRFPNNNQRPFNNFNGVNPFYNENNGRFRKLPGINSRDQDNRRVSDPVAAFRAMEITDIRPRQTKTSLKRYSMTRPKLHPLFESSVDSSNIDSQYTGMLSRVPDLLSVNGYSVNQEYKYNIPGIRRNIPRHNCLPNGI